MMARPALRSGSRSEKEIEMTILNERCMVKTLDGLVVCEAEGKKEVGRLYKTTQRVRTGNTESAAARCFWSYEGWVG